MMTLTKKQFESIEVLIGDPPSLSFEKTMVLQSTQ